MNDKVFELYLIATSNLNDAQKEIFKLGFDLGISEGTSRCVDKLDVVNKANRERNDLLRKKHE